MSDRTAWRITFSNGCFSACGNPKRGEGRRPGPPVDDALCAVVTEHGRTRHEFAADAPNQLWLTNITEHTTTEGKLYCSAIKDACSGRIVGYSIDSRMKSRLAVQAHENAIAMRGDIAGCIMHTPTPTRRPKQGQSLVVRVAPVSSTAPVTRFNESYV